MGERKRLQALLRDGTRAVGKDVTRTHARSHGDSALHGPLTLLTNHARELRLPPATSQMRTLGKSWGKRQVGIAPGPQPPPCNGATRCTSTLHPTPN